MARRQTMAGNVLRFDGDATEVRSDEVDLHASLRAVMHHRVEVEECPGPLPFRGAEKRDSQLLLGEDARLPSPG